MPPKRFISDIRVSAAPGLSIRDIRDLAKHNPALFMERVQKLIGEKKLTLGQMRDMNGLFGVLHDVAVPVRMNIGGAVRTISASAFPILTGSLVIAAMNDAYQGLETIGEQLVTELEDAKKVTSISAIHSMDKDISSVKETDEFPEISATEEKAEIRHLRNGRMLTISQESIEENEIPDIVNRVNALAEISSDWVEEQTIYRIYDYYGSAAAPAAPYVYRPDGTGTALYSATANTPGKRAPLGNWVQNNALADETDLEAARIRLSNMLNGRGKRISVPQSLVKVLVPNALVGKMLKISNSQYVPGVENEVSNWGPQGKWWIPPERIVSSPKLDDISATCWLFGAFQKQFVRKWKLRFEYVTLGMDTESYLKRRIAFQARIAWDVEIGATDYVYVVINTAAAAMPKDA